MHTTCAMYSSILYISQMIVNINCPSKVVSRHHVLSYVNLTLNVRHIMILYKEGTYLKPVSSCSSSKTSQYSVKMSFGKVSTLSTTVSSSVSDLS